MTINLTEDHKKKIGLSIKAQWAKQNNSYKLRLGLRHKLKPKLVYDKSMSVELFVMLSHSKNYTYSEIGEALRGISRQRVHQILSGFRRKVLDGLVEIPELDE